MIVTHIFKYRVNWIHSKKSSIDVYASTVNLLKWKTSSECDREREGEKKFTFGFFSFPLSRSIFNGLAGEYDRRRSLHQVTKAMIISLLD